jgi:LruC domain-containing protein
MPRWNAGRALIAAMFVTVPAPALAVPGDADDDGVLDAADAFPCDATRASVTYLPGQTTSTLLAFEDQWPSHTDLDFNDVVVRAHYRLERRADGNVVLLFASFDPVALGGDLDNGLGLVLPAPRAGLGAARRRVNGGSWQALSPEVDPELTLVLSSNLRELYGNAGGRLNSLPGVARTNGARVELEVTFSGGGAALSAAAAPFDVFIFRVGSSPRHEIHFPQYSGTAAMNTALFNTGQDRSVLGTRAFVHLSGVPAGLNLQTTTRYPSEGVQVAALFPGIVSFATSGGTQGQGFYETNVQAGQGHDVPAPPVPVMEPPSVSCIGTTSGGCDTNSANAPASCRAFDVQTAVAPANTVIGDGGRSVRSVNGDATMATSFRSVSAGKWYFEARAPAATMPFCGFGLRPKAWTNSPYILRSDVGTGRAFAFSGSQLDWGVNQNLGWWGAETAYLANQVIGVSLDMDSRAVTFKVMGVDHGPYAIASPAGTAYAVAASGWSTCYWVVNFGQAAFTHPVPAGYNAGF